MLTVLCVKTKPRYGAEYVNRLFRAVSRNLTVEHRFVCLTDDSTGVACETMPMPRGLQGWWGKIAMFRPGLFNGPVLYIDLDTLITGNLDFVTEYKGDFAILRDFYRPDGYGSGVMMWNRPHEHVWKEWVMAGCPNHPLGDQGWMEAMIPNADRLQDVFPDKIASYKVHCFIAGNEVEPPRGTSILCFHGTPKQDDFPADHWVTRTWRE